MTDKKLCEYPLFFEKNRVGRVYTGGALFASFYGDDSTDGFQPEEWIASSVRAINKDSRDEHEGVSRIRGTDIWFDTLLKENTREMLGDRETFGVLTKTLDSAIRLPIQAHPDKAFSRRCFSSDYGKAEAWLVLATRPGACIYFGFKDGITKQRFSDLVEESREDKNVMEPYLNRVEVKPGDVFFVPAKMVHAIGAGCLILEVQEPTDFTIQPEYFCGDYELNEQEMYIGLDKETALDVFDYSYCGEKTVAMGRKQPKITKRGEGYTYETLIGYDDTPCFSLGRYNLTASDVLLEHTPAVYVVTDGTGEVRCGEQVIPVHKGDYFFLPYAAQNTVLKTASYIQAAVCLPPRK
ncbi:MAG: class I mannose-6-phosphate isomerase [Clostridia bacterium]|nr:class I mannose-6-phosphate isomerase [Clostridia bacterium]